VLGRLEKLALDSVLTHLMKLFRWWWRFSGKWRGGLWLANRTDSPHGAWTEHRRPQVWIC
jgi:hypothetical protein